MDTVIFEISCWHVLHKYYQTFCKFQGSSNKFSKVHNNAKVSLLNILLIILKVNFNLHYFAISGSMDAPLRKTFVPFLLQSDYLEPVIRLILICWKQNFFLHLLVNTLSVIQSSKYYESISILTVITQKYSIFLQF